jgi:hypothetical protein
MSEITIQGLHVRIATLEAENAQLKVRADALQVAGDAMATNLTEQTQCGEGEDCRQCENNTTVLAKWDEAKRSL